MNGEYCCGETDICEGQMTTDTLYRNLAQAKQAIKSAVDDAIEPLAVGMTKFETLTERQKFLLFSEMHVRLKDISSRVNQACEVITDIEVNKISVDHSDWKQ